MSNTAAYSDVCVLYGGPNKMITVTLTKGLVVHGQYGIYAHDDLVGQVYGTKVRSSKGVKGWMYLLKMIPEIFTNGGAQTRTQVIHSMDIAVILHGLEIRAGSRVAESGTGSGSLTCSLGRLVGPGGHVYTYEFHRERADMARQLFHSLGMSRNVTVTLRDVCAEGFLVEATDDDGGHAVQRASLDAIFLDLPSPDLAVSNALSVLKPGRMLCSYSPCVEQVQRTCAALRAQGCDEIRTIESIERPWGLSRTADRDWNVDVTAPPPPKKQKQKQKRAPKEGLMLSAPSGGEIRGHTAFLTFARKPL